MGMDLRGAGGCFRFSITGWEKVLDLARCYGWKPTGTVAPDHWTDDLTAGRLAEWSGCYFSNEYQRVQEADAAAIATALAAALDDVPDHQTAEYQSHDVVMANARHSTAIAAIAAALGDTRITTFGPDPELSPLNWFSGPEAKQKLRDFIAYCQAGEFCIG